jgi:hypothetical protein
VEVRHADALSVGLGLAILAAAYMPAHRLLSPEAAGPAGIQTRTAAEAAWQSGLLGTGIVLVIAVLLARMVEDGPQGRVRSVAQRLTAIPTGTFCLGVSGIALIQTALVAAAIHGGRPTSVDEMAQLMHARALLEGGLSLPIVGPPEAWSLMNGVVTDGGWVSIYPPLHTFWLAAWLSVGAAWMAGPAATAVTVGLTAWCADRLLESRPAARLAGLIMACTPFLLLLGGTHLSHATAGAAAAAVAASAYLTATRGWRWSVPLGAAIGAAVCARPWTGMVLSTALVLTITGPAMRTWGARGVRQRLLGITAGGAPFALLLFWWNQALFGHPLRLGYSVAFGPSHGLGLHTDPWGNTYGLREALAYTGADLTQLGAHLFESPLPALGIIGVGLMVVRLPRGAGAFLAWAVAGVAANAAYWHHGVHMGPRMLLETAPAWVVLWASLASALASNASPGPPVVRRTAFWAAVLSLVGGLLLAPGVMRAYRATPGAEIAATLPTVPTTGRALVFVHGSWASRVANRLASAGMRRDSVETAMRRNGICAVDRYARERMAGDGTSTALSLDAVPGTPSNLQARTLSPGNVVRVDPNVAWDPTCVREARADRLGTLELEPLAWQTAPRTGRMILVRDLGPATNALIMAGFPDRQVWLSVPGPGASSRTLLPYDEGAELLWGGAAGVSEVSGGS